MSFLQLPLILALVLTLAVLLAWTRLLLWQRAAPIEARSRTWRIAALMALQPLCAVLLYFTLLPPTLPGEAGTMVVATAGATAAHARDIGAADRIVALPETSEILDSERVPDLATALRRHPGTQRLRVIGAGLEARDRDAARGLTIAFAPPELPAGVVRLDSPARVSPGSTFQVGGRVHGVEGGTVELLDPAGQRVDAMTLGKDGEFVLRGSARDAGLAILELLVRDANRKPLENVPVPLWTAAYPAPRVLILAGAPGAELKFLRRWATDAGLESHVQVSVGGGLQLGDAPLPLNAGTLDAFDLAIVDERSWASLGAGQRAALGQAVRDGLGLLLRVTGPLPPSTRSQWQALGLDIAGGSDSAAVKLDAAATDDEALRALRGPGTREVPIAADADQAQPPELSRRVVRADPTQAAPLLRAADGTPLAHWRASGRGRVGVWALTDTYLLALAGRHDLHAQLWSEAVSTLARPADNAAAPEVRSLMRLNQRITVCGLGDNPQVQAPDGFRTTLLIDPATGLDTCAGYWPDQAGWHQLQQGNDRWPFHVSDRDAVLLPGPLPCESSEDRRGVLPGTEEARADRGRVLVPGLLPCEAGEDRGGLLSGSEDAAGIRSAELQGATLQLAQQSVSSSAASLTGAPARRSSPWPWFFAWLLAAAALWWLERARLGRALHQGSNS